MLEWQIDHGIIDYPAALVAMEAHVAAMLAGKADEKIWLLQHPPLYTGGTSAAEGEIAAAPPFPVYETGRGGRYTYHGPGQRVAYVMLDLSRRGRDVRAYVANLENWVIAALADLGVRAEKRAGRIGLWVQHGAREEKIAAIGVRLKRWISFHGVSINVNPDLSHFDGIVPCGLSASEYGVTSLAALGVTAGMDDLDRALQKNWPAYF